MSRAQNYHTFPSVTVLKVSINLSLVSKSGVWLTNLQHSSTIDATAYGESKVIVYIHYTAQYYHIHN